MLAAFENACPIRSNVGRIGHVVLRQRCNGYEGGAGGRRCRMTGFGNGVADRCLRDTKSILKVIALTF